MSKTITDFKEQVRRHFRVNGRWLKQAQESYAFEAGKQWSDADMAVMKKRNRPTFVANLVRPHINMICGYAISSPYEPEFLPRGQGDADVCRVLKSITNWVKDTTGYMQSKEESFRDKVITGRGFRWWDYDFDFDAEVGKIRCQRISPFSVYWDPESTESDFSDAQFVGRLMWMDKEELKERYPQKEGEIEETFSKYMEEENQGEAVERRIWFSDETKRIRVAEHWYRATRPETVHKVGDQLLTWEELSEVEQAAADAGLLKTRRIQKSEIRIAVFAEDAVLEDIPSPYLHGGFPLVQDVGYTSKARDAQEEVSWVEPVGVTYDLLDVQRELNKMRSMGMEYLNKGLNAKFIGTRGTLTPEDKKALKESGTNNDPILEITGNPGALREISPPSIPIAVAEMESRNRIDFREISGYNEQTLGGGYVSGSASGRALQIKQQQAAMQIAYLLKNTFYSECQDLKILWGGPNKPGLIPQFLSEGEVLRIAVDGEVEDVYLKQGLTGPKEQVPEIPLRYEEGQFVLRTVYDLSKFEYDVVINNSPQTPTTRLANLYALNDAIMANPMLAQIIPPELYLELMDIPGLKQRLKEQQQKMAEAQAQMAMQQAIAQSQQQAATQAGAMAQNTPMQQNPNNQMPELGAEELAMLLTQLQQAEGQQMGQSQPAPIAEPSKPTAGELLQSTI